MTNAQILAAVITKWGEPVIPVLMGTTLNGMASAMLPVEKFLKATGIVGPAWSLSGEMGSLVSLGGTRMVQPFLESYMARIPDAMIPEIAHNYVESAIAQGQLSILDGKFVFDKEDLTELKKYLDCNLPFEKKEEYVVKVPAKQSAVQTPKPEVKEKE